MENKNITEIIELTENAPFLLNKITNDVFAIESNFNTIVKNLNNEIESIENTSKNTLTFLQNQLKQKLVDNEKNLKEGTYIPFVLQKQMDTLNDNITVFNVLKWSSLIIGIIVLFKVQWFIGIIIAIAGLAIFYNIVEGIRGKISRIYSFMNRTIYTDEDFKNILNISDSVSGAIINEKNRLKREFQTLQDQLNDEYKNKESKEFADKNDKLDKTEKKKSEEIGRAHV